MPYLIGIAGLLLIWLFYRLFSGKWDILSLATGDDGLPSSSQFQFLLWTAVVIFSYLTIYAARTREGEYGPIAEIPVNLLILTGISSFAMVASKGISLYHLSSGTASMKKVSPEGNRFRYIIGDVAKERASNKVQKIEPALNKVQMIAWTFIAVVIYIVLVVRQVEDGMLPILPDVDESLLVLMGISQGTYLGRRLVSITTPTLRAVTQAEVRPGMELTLTGENFGDRQEGNVVRLVQVKAGEPKPAEYYLSVVKEENWKSTSIQVVLPTGIPAGEYSASVIVGGKETNPVTLTVE